MFASDQPHVIPDRAFSVVYGPQTNLHTIVFGDSLFNIQRIGNYAFSAIPNLNEWISFYRIPVGLISQHAFDFDEPSDDQLSINFQLCSLTENSFEANVFTNSKRPVLVNLGVH